MSEELTITCDSLNSYDVQITGTGSFVVPASAGTPISEADYGSFLNGTQIAYGIFIEKTTGTPFQVGFVNNRIIKYTYSYNSSVESLLSFLNIVNNKDGWSFLQQRCVNSIINN